MKWLPFNQGNSKTQWGVALILVLLIVGFATKCAAADGHAQIGMGSTVVRGAAPVLDLNFVYPEGVPGDADLEVGATFIGGSTFRDAYQQNNFAIRATAVEKLWRFDVGLGVAYLQNVDTYNGSHVNFNLVLGYRMKRLPLTLRLSHFSNGGTRSPNKGRDMLLVFWRFQ
jgi:hypothetical protein